MATGYKPKYADGTDSGWLELTNSTVFTGTVYYRRIGPFVIVRGRNLQMNSAVTYFAELGVLPAGYRPSVAISSVAITNTNSNYNKTMPVMIADGGNIYLFKNDVDIPTSWNLQIYAVFVLG